MRKSISAVCLLLLVATGSAIADTRDVVRSVTERVVSFGKDIVGGVAEGVDSGRKGAEGTDGSIVVGKHEELAGVGQIRLIGVQPWEGATATVTVEFAIDNRSDKPLRLVGFTERGSLLRIDHEGFATPLAGGHGNPAELTVPAKASIKQAFVFQGSPKDTRAVRVWGTDYALAAER
ncbi:hypothetical protein [Denitratimonas tolerans]|uniref:DUF4352 domain-containing protein n=1 Tax=Denitratimonas tolerans TaxID=1338420 RepID=A0AAW9RAS4_9GAMM